MGSELSLAQFSQTYNVLRYKFFKTVRFPFKTKAIAPINKYLTSLVFRLHLYSILGVLFL